MRTDTLFYQLFLTFPHLVFELLKIPPVEGYQFCSREIKELARRFDGIYSPPENQTQQPIYFIEVQFQDKEDFWWRFMAEIFVYLGQYQPQNDWFAVALFQSRKLDTGVPLSYQLLVDGGKIKTIYLDEIEISEESSVGLDLIAITVSKESEAIAIAQKAYQKSRQEYRTTTIPPKVLELIETALVYKLKNLSREEIEAMFTYDDLKDTRYFQQVALENREKGKLEERLNLILRLLKRKLGNLPVQLEGKIRNLSFNTLENLAEDLLDFNSVSDLIQWLDRNLN